MAPVENFTHNIAYFPVPVNNVRSCRKMKENIHRCMNYDNQTSKKVRYFPNLRIS